MDLVVGRVAKAHGIAGEIVVDVRTDDPDTRFARGATVRARPGRGGAERKRSPPDAHEENAGTDDDGDDAALMRRRAPQLLACASATIGYVLSHHLESSVHAAGA